MRIDVSVSGIAASIMSARQSLGPTVCPLLVAFDHGGGLYTNPESGAPIPEHEITNATAQGLFLALSAS